VVPFKGPIWSARLAVEKLARTALALQDLLRLLEVQQHQPVAGEMNVQRLKLERKLLLCLGLTMIKKGTAARGGEVGVGDELADTEAFNQQSHDMVHTTADHGKLLGVLRLPKGMRLTAQTLLQLPVSMAPPLCKFRGF
jgi:hypothetical protein